MPFYEIEILVDSLKILAEKEEEERKKQEKKSNGSMKTPNLNMGSQMRDMQRGMNMPSLPNFKL